MTYPMSLATCFAIDVLPQPAGPSMMMGRSPQARASARRRMLVAVEGQDIRCEDGAEGEGEGEGEGEWSMSGKETPVTLARSGNIEL
jgi:hypothetical protein